MIAPSFSLTATERVLPRMALDFTSGVLDSRVTFTRSTTGTYFNSAGVLTSAAINEARFDYNPTTLAPLGLLIEGQRTNLLTYSEDFTQASYTKFSATVTANTGTSPSGTLTADLLTPPATTAYHGIISVVAVTASTAYSASVFIKSDGAPFVQIGYDNGASVGAFMNVNTVTGAITRGPEAAFAAPNPTGGVVSVGNGWFRVSVGATHTSATGRILISILPAGQSTAGQTPSTTTAVTDKLLIWGAQLEAGSFPTSYIPTVASQVTRAADVAVMTGTNFSDWFNASAGTFRATYEASPNTFTTYLVASNGVTAQNSFHFDNDSGNMRAVYYSGSSAVATLGLGVLGTAGTVNSVASSYAVNNFVAARNAGTVVTDTAGAVPVSLTQLNIGADPSGAAVNVMNTRIQKIYYYPLALTNAEVQAFSKG